MLVQLAQEQHQLNASIYVINYFTFIFVHNLSSFYIYIEQICTGLQEICLWKNMHLLWNDIEFDEWLKSIRKGNLRKRESFRLQVRK